MTQSSVLSPQSFPGWTPGFQAALERLAIAARRPAAGRQGGMVRSRQRGRALEFADYRAYTPGDDPNLVDWRAYTRLDRLYLKRYEEERARTLTLLIDTSASLDWGDGEPHKGRCARRLAAALAWIALSRQEPVRVHLLRDGGALPLPPVSSRSGAVALFRRLGDVRESGRTDLAASLRATLPGGLGVSPMSRGSGEAPISRGSVSSVSGRAPGPVVLLTDLLDPGWPDALGALAATGEATVLQVLAPAEWEPPLGEEVELEDAETGELRATRLGPRELDAYRQRRDTFLSQIREHCRRLGVVHVALDTGKPLTETVLRRLPEAGVLE